MSVDLPEPFWPTSAWISPGLISSEASISARVAPNVFDSPATCSTGGTGAVPLGLGVCCMATLMSCGSLLIN